MGQLEGMGGIKRRAFGCNCALEVYLKSGKDIAQPQSVWYGSYSDYRFSPSQMMT